ncbi:HNH endonuclease [Pseudomonas zeae]|uniref:HNH endonuclease n=1 Tax=Pseudomonas zeae TaxID=2745510 RepID=UPI0039E0D0F3
MSPPGSRPGLKFTKNGKMVVKKENIDRNGALVCELCDKGVVNALQHQRGIRPPDNEAHIDHIKPQVKNGSGTPENGQVLCRICNINKSDSWEP